MTTDNQVTKDMLSDVDWFIGVTGSTLDNREILTGGCYPMWLVPIKVRLEKIADLPENWDSYGANRIKESSVISAFNLLLEIMKDDTPVPQIVPTPEGNVQLEWHERDMELEIEVKSNTLLDVYCDDLRSNDEPYEKELEYDLGKLTGFIDKLTSRN